MERPLIPSEIKKLSVAERILLVEEIWDSIAVEQEVMGVIEAQMRELDQRLASFEASEHEGRSWEEVKNNLVTTR